MANGMEAAPSIKTIGILMGLLGLTVGFVPSYFIANTGIQVLTHEVATIQRTIESNMDNRYRSTDAERDLRIIAERELAMKNMIQSNAAQIRKLEALLRDHAGDRDNHP